MLLVLIRPPWRWLRAGAALALLGGLVFLLTRAAPVYTTPLTELLSGKTVVIDPGHGGPDPGCTKGELAEKEITLDIALRLAERFRQAAMRPVLSRTTDADLGDPGSANLLERKRDDLRRRAGLAEKHGADLLISIHANSFPSPLWSGAQVFHYPGSKPGEQLARALQDALVAELGPNFRREKAGDFLLLARSSVPAAMVEVGFLSNPREAQLLSEPEYRDRVATAVFHGAVRFLVDQARGVGREAPIREAHAPAARQEERRRRWQAVADRGPDEIVLYFAGPTNGEDWLTPELRLSRGFSALPRAERIALAIQELGKGPGPGSALLPLLPAGTRTRSVSLEPGLVTVELSPEFRRLLSGGYTEVLAVYSIVNTVGELAPECKVRLTAGGAPLELDHLDLPLTLSPRPGLALPGRDGAAEGAGRLRLWTGLPSFNSFAASSRSAPSRSAVAGRWSR